MHEEKLLMDIFINPHQVPHYVSYAFSGFYNPDRCGMLVKSSIKLIPANTEFHGNCNRRDTQPLRREYSTLGKTFFPLIATIALFIAVCNFMGLIQALHPLQVT